MGANESRKTLDEVLAYGEAGASAGSRLSIYPPSLISREDVPGFHRAPGKKSQFIPEAIQGAPAGLRRGREG
jgi:hypothetical protein